MVKIKIIGKNASLYLIFLSVWGTIQLSAMAVLFQIKSVGLVEDVPESHHLELKNLTEFYDELDRGFDLVGQFFGFKLKDNMINAISYMNLPEMPLRHRCCM